MNQAPQDRPDDKEVRVILDHDCTRKKNDDCLKKQDGRVEALLYADIGQLAESKGSTLQMAPSIRGNNGLAWDKAFVDR